jgi:hypothetical protein
MQVSIFLKRVLILDALSCLGMGAGLAIGSSVLGSMFGLPDKLVLSAGLGLIPVGLFILWAGTRHQIAPLFLYAIIAGNAVWVAESVVVASDTPGITMIGAAFVLTQAAAVAMLALLETAGVLRSRNVQAAA